MVGGDTVPPIIDLQAQPVCITKRHDQLSGLSLAHALAPGSIPPEVPPHEIIK